MLARNPCHGGLAEDAAVLREEVRQRNTTVPSRHAIGQHTIQKGLCVGASHVVFGKAGQVDQAYPFAHGCAFVTHTSNTLLRR